MPMPRCSLSASKCSLRGLIDRRSGGTSEAWLSLIRRSLLVRLRKSIRRWGFARHVGLRRRLCRALARLVEITAVSGNLLLGRTSGLVEIALPRLDFVRTLAREVAVAACAGRNGLASAGVVVDCRGRRRRDGAAAKLLGFLLLVLHEECPFAVAQGNGSQGLHVPSPKTPVVPLALLGAPL